MHLGRAAGQGPVPALSPGGATPRTPPGRRRGAWVLAVVSVLAVAGGAVSLHRGGGVARVAAIGHLIPAAAPTPGPDPSPLRYRSPALDGPGTPPARPAPTTTVPTTTISSAPVAVAIADPVELLIPAIGVDATVVPVGVVAGTNDVEVPPLREAGWYRYGPSPGEAGSSVLVGHVDGDGQRGIFWSLRNLALGIPVTVRYADGSSRAFAVSARAEELKTSLPPALFSRIGPPQLTLITCGGAFDASTHHYLDNVVVVATPTGS